MTTPATYFFRNVKHHIIPYVCPIGIILNIILLILIVKKTTIKEYKKVFLLTCISELAFCAGNLFFTVTLTVENNLYFVLIEGIIGHLSPSWTYVGYSMTLFFLYISITNNTVVFVFRYLSVCRDKNLSTVPFMFLVFFGWLVVLVYIAFVLITYLGQEDPAAYKALNGTEFPSDGSFTRFISSTIPPLIPLTLFGGFSIITVSYTIVIGTSIAVYRKFNKLKSMMSPEQKKFHREVTIALSMEALTPFLSIALPVYIDISKLVFLNLPTQWFAEFVWCLCLLGPSMTAIVKILSIRVFRQTLMQLLFKSRKDRVLVISSKDKTKSNNNL